MEVLKTADNNTPFLFVKSWNEWGEGNYMEPDTIYKKGYIAAIVGDGIGVPILSSMSCFSNIGIIDFKTLSCSNLRGIALISIASK